MYVALLLLAYVLTLEHPPFRLYLNGASVFKEIYLFGLRSAKKVEICRDKGDVQCFDRINKSERIYVFRLRKPPSSEKTIMTRASIPWKCISLHRALLPDAIK